MDVDNIPLGGDLAEVISAEVAQCETLLAIIGPRWLELLKAREGDPKDFVRIEIAAALERGIPVIPVLVDGAKMPHKGDLPEVLRGLELRSGAEIARRTFQSDAEDLAARLGLAKPAAPRRPVGAWLFGTAAVAILVAGGWWFFITNSGPGPVPPQSDACTPFWSTATYTITYYQTSGVPGHAQTHSRALTITQVDDSDGEERLRGTEAAGFSVEGNVAGNTFSLRMSRAGEGDFTINGECGSTSAQGTGSYTDNAGDYRTYDINITK